IGIAGKPHAVTAVAVIGPQTAQTAAEYGLRVDVTAPRPSATALVDALAEHGARLRDAAIAAGGPHRQHSPRRRRARRRLPRASRRTPTPGREALLAAPQPAGAGPGVLRRWPASPLSPACTGLTSCCPCSSRKESANRSRCRPCLA